MKRGDKAAVAEDAILAKFEPVLDSGKLALTVKLTPEEKAAAKSFFLLTDKPTIFACNVKESDLATADQNPFVQKVREYVKTHLACENSADGHQRANQESDLALMICPRPMAKEFLKELGVSEVRRRRVSFAAPIICWALRTYFTAGEKEVRAWTIHIGDTAPKAAGVIHTDFERGFIKAETVAYADLVQCGSVAIAREKGLYRMEGKEYVVKDGDVLLFQIQRRDFEPRRRRVKTFILRKLSGSAVNSSGPACTAALSGIHFLRPGINATAQAARTFCKPMSRGSNKPPRKRIQAVFARVIHDYHRSSCLNRWPSTRA